MCMYMHMWYIVYACMGCVSPSFKTIVSVSFRPCLGSTERPLPRASPALYLGSVTALPSLCLATDVCACFPLKERLVS